MKVLTGVRICYLIDGQRWFRGPNPARFPTKDVPDGWGTSYAIDSGGPPALDSVGTVWRPQSARLSDAPTLLQLRDAAANWMLRRHLVQWAPGEVSREALEGQVNAGEWHVLRTDDEEVFAALRLLWSDELTWGTGEPVAGYVHGLVVARTAAGRGIGAELLRWAGTETLACGRLLLRLDCFETNADLRRYYRGQGFREVGRHAFNSDRWHAVTLLERDLGAANPRAHSSHR